MPEADGSNDKTASFSAIPELSGGPASSQSSGFHDIRGEANLRSASIRTAIRIRNAWHEDF
jgi:hypothetical protein